MDPSTPLQNPNSSKHDSGVYQICGVPVEFPYKPYGSQLAFMGRVISALDRARRQGHCHALLESPTGTGKSLSLLCSSLAWQRHQHSRFLTGVADPSRSPPQSGPNHLVSGGGFIPETHPSSDAEPPPVPASARARKRLMAPKIYYASRTHSQISQVIREYRKTSYRVPMAILASRKHYCTNKNVCTKESVDEDCKLLLRDEGLGCSEFKNANKVKSHPSLQKGGCYEVHDIEDLVKVGRSVKGCSYFAAQTLAEEAQLVFCPYNYIVNPIVRRAMDIDIKGCIVILDEAHNIEDVARDAGSLEVEEDVLFALQTELGQLCMTENGAVVYRPLHDMIEGIISWIGDRKVSLQKCDFEHYSSFWTGDKAMRELQQAGITQQSFPILQECATKAIKAASDAESVENHLNGLSAIILEGLFSSLSFLFSGNGCHAVDYQLALQKYVKRDKRNTADGWICKLSLWCLNPSVVFKEIANLSLSVILTSGTLSPMSSFASELGVQFEACMEAPHVINVDSQLLAAVVPTGPANCQLNASYRTADAYAFQDGLGVSLEEICKIAPGGVLVFFPSYKLLEKLHLRWSQTGQWSRLNAQKPHFIEPRATDEFESVLKDYYDAINGNTRVASEKKRLGSKRVSKHPSSKVCLQNSSSGAAFLAVCRGKVVSEGIDFSDENARVVVIVGIPFPNINDIQVVLKKKYNDTYRSSKNLLSGSEWYCHQAFRALNQAAGRCIRHRFDYGAIILLDERFKEERNLMYVSKWLKNSIKHFDSFDESLLELRTFFENAQKQFPPKSSHSTCQDVAQTEMNSNFNEETSLQSKPTLDQGNQIQNIKSVKVNHQNARKITNQDGAASAKPNKLTKSSRLDRGKGSLSSLKSYYNTGTKAASETNVQSPNCSSNCVDVEPTNQTQFKCLQTISSGSCEANLHQPMGNRSSLAGYNDAIDKSISKVENLYQTVAPLDQYLDKSFSPSTTLSNGTISDGAHTPTHSPETIKHMDPCNSEKEKSLNMSVNSHNQKRRKLVNLQMTGSDEIDYFNSDIESFYHVDSISSISRVTDEIPESPIPDNYSVCKHQKSREGMFLKNEHSISAFSLSEEKNLELSCLLCKNRLGLHENDFLVKCSLTSSSKVYLKYVLKYGPPKDGCLDWSPSTLEANVPVVACDTSSVSRHIFDRDSKEATSQHGFWSEEDGCVFRILTCHHCTVPKTFLGVQIIAADESNIHLLNKILFYADRLDIKDEQTSKEKDVTIKYSSVPGQGSALAEIDN
ncbi:hypothetical protein Cni_G14044 [Canna indica]|uniref:DNA 5'-3' helicase FANCJ n=1 Tax=Canna indica TaxID=4628 RepID=A0AAQ3QAB5_9LILI|nr:hypothetical protein Cni_G14044 [Canna indica]